MKRALPLVLAMVALVVGTAPTAPARASSGMKRFTIPDVDTRANDTVVKCTSSDGKITSSLYLVAAAGSKGVPDLTPDQKHQATLFPGGPKNLRFTFVGPQRRLVMFRATGIICRHELYAYRVLNGACSDFWSPSDEADRIVTAPSCYERNP